MSWDGLDGGPHLDGLSRRAETPFRAAVWSGADVAVRHGVQLAVLVVLARLVTPAEFGQLAIVLLFVGVAGVLVDAGLTTAVIQRQDLDETHLSTTFWLNVGIGCLVAVLMAACAPLVAAFYGSDALVPLTLVMAVNVLLASTGAVHAALLTKRLDFRRILHAGVTGSVLSGAVAVGLALAGAGVWALAAQVLVMTAVSTAMLWRGSRWRPRRRFSGAAARQLFGFGAFVLVTNLVDLVFTRLYTVLVGRTSGLRDVGIYQRADATQQLPVDLLSSVVSRVALPIFSESASHPEQLRAGARTSIRALMFLSTPALLVMAALAEPLVIGVYGEPWRDVVPLLQVLCLGGLLWPLHVIAVQLLLAQGRVRELLVLELLKKLLGTLALVLGLTLAGLVGLAWGQVAAGVMAFLLNAAYTRRHLGYGALAQLRDVVPVLPLALLVAGASAWAARAWSGPPLAVLLVVGAAAAVAFVGSAHLLRLSVYRDLRSAFAASGADQ